MCLLESSQGLGRHITHNQYTRVLLFLIFLLFYPISSPWGGIENVLIVYIYCNNASLIHVFLLQPFLGKLQRMSKQSPYDNDIFLYCNTCYQCHPIAMGNSLQFKWYITTNMTDKEDRRIHMVARDRRRTIYLSDNCFFLKKSVSLSFMF